MYKPLIDYDYELEASVLGILILEPDAYGRIFGTLLPDCFYKPEHARIFEAIDQLYDAGYPIDLLTVSRHFYDRGVAELGGLKVLAYVQQLTLDVCTSAHLARWCVMLRQLAVQRTALTITSSGIDRSEDVLEVAADLEQKLRNLMDIHTTDDWEDGGKVAMKLLQHMEDMAAGGGNWVTTGIRDLDEANGGFRPGQLILVGARPGVGKSAFMGRMAIRAAESGKRCGIITLEMDSKDVFGRMVSFYRDIEFHQLDKNEFYSEAERQAAFQAISDTAALQIFFSDRAQVNMKEIRAKGEKLKRKHDIDILYIDYLQLIEADESKNAIREQQVAKISKGCKNLARHLQIPVVLLVQLNRQAADDEPQLKHLRESGSLEQDADIVMMLFRDTDAEDPAVMNAAMVFIRKWRNGSVLKIPMHFDGPRMKFMEMSELARDFASAADYRARMPEPPPIPSRLYIDTGHGGRKLKPLAQAMKEFDNPDEDAPF